MLQPMAATTICITRTWCYYSGGGNGGKKRSGLVHSFIEAALSLVAQSSITDLKRSKHCHCDQRQRVPSHPSWRAFGAVVSVLFRPVKECCWRRIICIIFDTASVSKSCSIKRSKRRVKQWSCSGWLASVVGDDETPSTTSWWRRRRLLYIRHHTAR